MKSFFLSVVLVLGFGLNSYGFVDPIKTLPIQDGGRIKPFDTFTRESLSLIHGKDNYEGKPAIEVVMTWLLQPQAWENLKFIEIRYSLVKKALKFEETRKYFSFKEILENDRMSYVMQELQSKRETKAKLDPYFQALQRLEGQISVFRGIADGRLLRLVPPKEGTQWTSIKDWNQNLKTTFASMAKLFIANLDPNVTLDKKNEFTAAVENFESLAKQENPALYPEQKRMNIEVHYNQFQPFQKAWIFYLLASLMLVFLWMFKMTKRYANIFYISAWLFAGLGMGFHIYGFALRVYLSGRAPVSNMYETVVWVAFGTLLFSMIIEAIYKWRFILLAGTLVATFCLLLTDFAPIILDPSLEPLQAVLNSNFWLTTHVLTITISYAAFFLAFALGDIGLIYYFKGEPDNSPKIRAITLAIYRAIQIGVSLLAPGIILGGIWADYSWGRFWGWDPKETWALIALLGYIAVLHGKLAGLLKNFGMVAAAVVTFSLVIMAWYGVNFVLGAGLHSYGFGAGGVEYVASFVGLHLVAVIFLYVLRRSRAS